MSDFIPAEQVVTQAFNDQEQNSEKNPRMGLFRRFLFFTGGANIDLLNRYPWEKPKYLALALSVIIASAVSMITMIIALFGVLRENAPVLENGVENFRPQPFSPLGVIGIVLCAAVWGGIMYVLNWYFIIAMKIGGRFSKNILAMTIKIVFALAMSFMDTIPLQIALFKDYLPAVKNEKRVSYMEKMQLSEDSKIEAAEAKNQAAREDLQRWQTEEPESINRDPEVIDLRAKGVAIQKQEDELRPAYRDANNRAWNDINAAQNRLQSLRSWITALDQNAGEQNEELARVQDAAAKLEEEIRQRSAEISRRNRGLAELAGQKSDVEERLITRYQAIDADRAAIGQRLLEEVERGENAVEAAIQDAQKARSSSALAARAYEADDLVSSILALAVLAKGQGDFVETEIGKMVRQISFLLTVVIMFIDLGPVIILMFLDKGACEFALEQANLNAKFRITTEAEAFQQMYPETAQIIERSKLEMETRYDRLERKKQHGKLEMEMYQKITDWHTEFISILDSMRRRVEQDIDALIVRSGETENEAVKKMTIAYSEEMLRQFETTKDKMMLEFKNFIRSFTLSASRSTG
jgi:hypothetical protein